MDNVKGDTIIVLNIIADNIIVDNMKVDSLKVDVGYTIIMDNIKTV